MEDYKKLSEYDVRTVLSMTDLFPTLVDNGDGTYSNKNVPLAAIRTYSAVPSGGTTNQVLKKTNGSDYATQWGNLTKTEVGLPNVDNTSDVNKPVSTATTAAINAAMAALYPVGSVYINASNSTNPGTLLGFGTWVAFGAGKVPVGFDSSQTEFNTAEGTGGSKTQTLTQANLPSGITGALVMHGGENATQMYVASGVFNSQANAPRYGNVGVGTSGVSSIATLGFDLGGSGTAHNNLQPYITVYMWKRTA